MRYLLLACVLVACGGGGAPDIVGLTDQVAVVGMEFVLQLEGTDPDGDRLSYDVTADIMLEGRASISQTPAGIGVFRWTPLAEDIGKRSFDFKVSDGDNTSTVSIQIDVRATAAGLPVFREPQGSGRVVNLTATPCIDISILIEDQDSSEVTIDHDEPIEGATLTQEGPLTATWNWCPTGAQVAASDRYTVMLTADDGDNPKQTWPYVLVLGGMAGGAKLVINEIDYDNIGTDSSEYVEILNVSTSTVSLAGLKIALINGAAGVSHTNYQLIDLSSVGSLTAGQYLVLAQPLVSVPTTAKRVNPSWTSDQIQNGGPDGIALYDDVTHTLMDALSYEGAITDAVIPGFTAPVSLVEGTVLDPALADSNDAIMTLCRRPNGADTNVANTDWKKCSSRTVGATNAAN